MINHIIKSMTSRVSFGKISNAKILKDVTDEKSMVQEFSYVHVPLNDGYAGLNFQIIKYSLLKCLWAGLRS